MKPPDEPDPGAIQRPQPVKVLPFSLENLRAVLPTPQKEAVDCSVCKAIGGGGSKLVISDTVQYDNTPAAVSQLRYFMSLCEYNFHNTLLICPLCDRLYNNEVSYEYLVGGSEDCDSYSPITLEEVLLLPQVSWASATGKSEIHALDNGTWRILHNRGK